MAGVGVGLTSPAGVGAGDASGVSGSACSPGSGVGRGDDAGTCARSIHVAFAVRHPTAKIKRLLTAINFLMGVLVQ